MLWNKRLGYKYIYDFENMPTFSSWVNNTEIGSWLPSLCFSFKISLVISGSKYAILMKKYQSSFIHSIYFSNASRTFLQLWSHILFCANSFGFAHKCRPKKVWKSWTQWTKGVWLRSAGELGEAKRQLEGV